ncbi:hypothetical protein HY490_04295 [Candidatus Woesearchaeota archaeon]|nr:hypothetical protein [Candidatus Woesearchaeota archaeon]
MRTQAKEHSREDAYREVMGHGYRNQTEKTELEAVCEGPVLDLEKLAKVELADPTKVKELIASARNGLRQQSDYLAQLLGDVPVIDREEADLPPTYARTPTSCTFYLGADNKRSAQVTLTVYERSKGWFKGSSSIADVNVETEFNKHSFSYEIPPNNDPLPDATETMLLHALEKAALVEDYKTAAEEQQFVRSVATILGIPHLVAAYFNKRYAQLSGQANVQTQELLLKGEVALEHLLEGVEREAETLTRDLKKEVTSDLNAKKSQAEQELLEEVTLLRTDLKGYEQAFKTALLQQKAHLEQEYSDRAAALEQEKKRLAEQTAERRMELERRTHDVDEKLRKGEEQHAKRTSELERTYQGLLEDLERKLAGQRAKVRADSFKIMPVFEELFPDHYANTTRTYETRVDHDLRVHYVQHLLEDMSTAPEGTVEQALEALKLIRRLCFKGSLEGCMVRTTYGGLRAVIDYISSHKVSWSLVLEQLKAAKKHFDSRPSAPTVEQYVEKALPKDFDMTKYERGLHKPGSRSKQDLGVK